MSKLLCCGDFHLGAGSEYGRVPGDRLADQEAVLHRIVDLAIAEQVDAVLMAGDAFHHRRPTPSEILALKRPLARLRAANIDALAVGGNHDVEAFDRPTALELLDDLIDVHREPGIWQGRGVTVCTLPWTPVARLVAARNGGDRDQVHYDAAQLLVEIAAEQRLPVHPNFADNTTILLGHWSVSGASTPTGILTDDFREPVIPASDLQALGFDYVVMGHIHRPQQLFGAAHHGFYVGSPGIVDFGEAESAHGVWLIDTEQGAQFIPISGRPFVTVEADLGESAADAVDDTLREYALMRPGGYDGAVVRVRYTATEEQARRIDHAALSRALYDAGAHKVYGIFPTITRTARARVAGVDEALAPVDAMLEWTRANDITGEQADQLGALTATFLEEVAA